MIYFVPMPMSEKNGETPQAPKEEVKTETSPEVKAPSPEQEKLAKLKDEVADLYVRKILNKRKG